MDKQQLSKEVDTIIWRKQRVESALARMELFLSSLKEDIREANKSPESIISAYADESYKKMVRATMDNFIGIIADLVSPLD